MNSSMCGTIIASFGIAAAAMANVADSNEGGPGDNCTAPVRSVVQIDQPREVAVSASTAFVLTNSFGLMSFDISDISNPIPLDTVALGSSTTRLLIDGDIAYCLSVNARLYTVDISDPQSMTLLSDFEVPITGLLPLTDGMAVQDDLVYVTSTLFTNEMVIVDVSDPSNPVSVTDFVAPANEVNSWQNIQVQGSYAYINGAYDIGNTGDFTGGIGVWDISDPMDITRVGFVATTVESFVLQDDYLYIDSPGLVIADISDPIDPAIISEVNGAGPDMGVSVDGQFAMYEDKYFNVADPANPYQIYRFSSLSNVVQMTLLRGNVVYAITNAGLEIVNIEDCGMVCAADLTGDDRVNFFDISLFLQLYTNQDPGADLNGDNSYDFNDVSEFLKLYSFGCS